jgi:hypothetical protein
VDEALDDVDPDRHLWPAAVDGARRQHLGIGGDGGPPVDPQRLVEPRHQEQQADLGLGNEVGQGVEPVVARQVAERQAPRVEHGDEAGRAAAGRGVCPATRSGGQHEERALGDQVGGPAVEMVDGLVGDDPRWRPVALAKLLGGGDR